MTDLTCHACGGRISILVTAEDNAPPHVRVAMCDAKGQPIKGQFRAYHVDCAPWWAEKHNARVFDPELGL